MRACVRSYVNACVGYHVRGRLECALVCVRVRRAGVRSRVVLRYRMRGRLACALSLSRVRAACVRVFACVRCRMRGCLACALTYVRKRLACKRGRRHTCASRAVYL